MGFSVLLGASTFPLIGGVKAPHSAEPVVLPSHTVTLTAYNAVAAQTDENPFETASGVYANPQIVAARSQDMSDYPFGTIIELDGSNASSTDTCGFSVVAPLIGYRVIADTMNARYTNRVDVLFDTESSFKTSDKGMINAANVLGICKGITARVVGYVNINRLPKTQAELAKIVNGTTGDLAVK